MSLNPSADGNVIAPRAAVSTKLKALSPAEGQGGYSSAAFGRTLLRKGYSEIVRGQ